MRLNLKALGLALVAAFALSAIGAQGAMAQHDSQDLFTSDLESTFLTGESTVPGVFLSQPGGSPVSCEKSTYAGTVSGQAVKQVTVHPVYHNCTALNTFPADVITDGCDYVLTGETDENEDATVDLDCTEGNEIEIIVTNEENPICTLSFGGPENQNLTGVHYDNSEENGKWDTEVTATVTGVHFEMNGPACFLVECERAENPTPGAEETCSNGVLEEEVTVTGYEYSNANQDPITHEWTVDEEEQTNITVTPEP